MMPLQGGRWTAAALVLLLNLLLHVPLLGTPPLAGTEAHRAVTAHQMVERGDPWVPILYGRVYLRKPPLHYQVLAAVEWATGRANTWVWRLPSVVWAGLTASLVLLAAWAWWGPTAGWAAGLLQSGAVALWAQSRSAEIDALNTLLATAAAIAAASCVRLEPAERAGSRRAGLRPYAAFGLALALLLTLAAKGPAGLPAALGVTLAAAWLVPNAWRSGPLWAGWAGGVALAALAALALKLELSRRGLPLDLSGVREGLDNLYDTRAGRYAQALLLPVQLMAFALPASAVLAWGAWRWNALSLRARWLLAAVPVSWGLCVLSGMVNPRYAYVTFPLAALAAAGVLSELAAAGARRPLRVAAAVAVVAMVLLALPLAYFNVENRERRSGYAAAMALQQFMQRQGLTGETVLVAQALRFQPEIMFYAGMTAHSPGENLPAPDALPAGSLLLVTDEELTRLRAARNVDVLVTVESNRRKLHLLRLMDAV
ncbi:MAG: ArnT family glycosyltransferase [Tepidisphaerales bacterium]